MFAAEEAYCQLMAEKVTGKRGKITTWDRTGSSFSGFPVDSGCFLVHGLEVDEDDPDSRGSRIGLAAASVISIEN